MVTAAVALCNTVDLHRAVRHLRPLDVALPDELLARVALLRWNHAELIGDSLWRKSEKPLGRFRPLCTISTDRRA
ncbi:Tn3 family transposase [Sphingomonas floccifaciens]|uniref:Tn3 family transposase n=1 Tax=Sphingomonas floccifaciens TaxID=1844115 RepID=A0ABW4NGQ3_9SPHN|nr:Tn3 family transposase [Sphingomonas metalli]